MCTSVTYCIRIISLVCFHVKDTERVCVCVRVCPNHSLFHTHSPIPVFSLKTLFSFWQIDLHLWKAAVVCGASLAPMHVQQDLACLQPSSSSLKPPSNTSHLRMHRPRKHRQALQQRTETHRLRVIHMQSVLLRLL